MNKSEKKKRCPNGTRRNPKTKMCEPVVKKAKASPPKAKASPPKAKVSPPKKNTVKKTVEKKKKKKTLIIVNSNNKPITKTKKNSPPKRKSPPTKRKRCPNGTKRNPKTGECVPVTKKPSMSVSVKPRSPEIKNKTCIFHEMHGCLKVGKYLNPSPPGSLADKHKIYLCEKHRDAHCVIIPNSKEKGYPNGVASCTTPDSGTYFLKVI